MIALAQGVQQVAQSRADEILTMIGPHGIYAIIGAIIVTRMLRVLWYLNKRHSLITGVIVSALLGAASVYFYSPDDSWKGIFGGAVMTIVGTIVTYELLKWAIGLAYQKLEWEILITLYFYLSPKPVKIQEDGETIEVPPNPTLTQFFDKARIDKMGDEDKTRVMTQEERDEITDPKRHDR